RAASSLVRAHARAMVVVVADLVRLRPYLLPIVVRYGAEILALTRNYSVPTYLPLGLAAAVLDITGSSVSAVSEKLSLRLICRVAALGCGFVLLMYLVVRSLAVWH